MNTQNDGVYSRSREEANLNGGLQGKSKYPLNLMLWAGMVNYGLVLHFIEKGKKIGSRYYNILNILLDLVTKRN